MGKETSAIKENPRAFLKAALWRFASRLILACETQAAPDDPIGLQGFFVKKEVIRESQSGLSPVLGFSIPPSLPEVSLEVLE